MILIILLINSKEVAKEAASFFSTWLEMNEAKMILFNQKEVHKKKIREAIEKTCRLHPNTMDAEDMCTWLSDLDQTIYSEIIQTKVDEPMEVVIDPDNPPEDPTKVKPTPVPFKPYEYDTDSEKELIVKAPYEELYIAYLSAKCDFYEGDTASYQNNMIMFDSLYKEYAAAYTRAHMPKQKGIRIF